MHSNNMGYPFPRGLGGRLGLVASPIGLEETQSLKAQGLTLGLRPDRGMNCI